MRRGVRFPQWFLLLVAVLGILSGCQSLRDLERFAIRHHAALNQALGLELRRPPTDSTFRYLFLQVDVAEICRQLQVWMLAQIPDGAAGLDQLVCDGKTLRGSIVATEFVRPSVDPQAASRELPALDARTAPRRRSGPLRGGHGGLSRRASPPARSTPWWRLGR